MNIKKFFHFSILAMKLKHEKLKIFKIRFVFKSRNELYFQYTDTDKIKSKNLLSMKIVVNYLDFVFHIEVKTKSKYKILNFVFQLSETRNGTLGTWI